MQEYSITSGRMMDHIDPVLSVWGWEVPVYLFLGGLVAGILFFSALYFLLNKEEEMPTTVRVTPLFAPILLGIGLFALFLDLEYKLHVYRFYMALRLQSPMSWGSWTLGVIFPLSAVWALLHAETAFPQYVNRFNILTKITPYFRKHINLIAWMVIIFAVLLGMYTGILLSAMNARPLWNTAILGPLFLVSGLSSGLAFTILISKNKKEKHILSKLDIGAIGVELFLITHLFMGLLSSTQVHFDAAQLFLGGPYTAAFWVVVVGLGLTLPAALELIELKGIRIPAAIPAVMVLAGGYALRIILVDAGQFSSWLPY
ncbi:NrfD/PsrC family molybdoenzyme membrane anchor subunit [candidate division KSB1 bacterium]